MVGLGSEGDERREGEGREDEWSGRERVRREMGLLR